MLNKTLLKSKLKNRQQGVVLVTSLVLLLIMTLIGLTGMQVTSLEEKMASNMRDSNLSFQVAESTLRAAELSLRIVALPPFVNNGANGLYSDISNVSILNNIDDTAEWILASGAGQTAVYNTGNFGSVASLPEYIIQQLNIVGGASGSGSLEATGFSAEGFYRVTARSIGATTSAVTVVQSIYRR